MSSLDSELVEFAIKSYKQLSNDQNLVFSPLSLSTALSMVLMGTRSTCAEELSTALFGKAIKDNEYESMAKELKELNDKCIANNSNVLSCANFVYNHKMFAVLPHFQQLLQKYFNAKSRELDFINKKTESVDVINEDIKNATNGKIIDMLKDISDDTAMILVNALYFKGLWSSKFNKDNTMTDKFTTNTGKQIDVKMMFKSQDIPFAYSQHLKASAIELSYEDSNAVMIVLLPDKDISLKQMANNMSVESLNQLVGGLRTTKLDVYLPKFKLESNLELIPTLNQMGINYIFDKNSADFSGLSEIKGLYVSNVIQKAVIEVTEEGTEAAAATVVMISLMCAPMNHTFKANRPFVYFVLTKNPQKEINSIIFMGECNDPNL